MKAVATLSALLALTHSTLALPREEEQVVKRAPAPDHARANAVRLAFKTAWTGYKTYAYPHDELLPISKGNADYRNAWGVTPVDALSTAIVMNEKDIVNTILNFTRGIDFSTTKNANDQVSLFETTIRYLGGLLASHDLLKGPYNRLLTNQSDLDMLLKQATAVADSLSICFDTPSGVADGHIYLNPTHRLSGGKTSGLAEMGTLVLEWTRLSDLTGNKTYAALAQKCQSYLIHPKGAPEAWPGLPGNEISIATGNFTNSDGGWSGGTDSFYEYLIKMYLYDPTRFKEYKDRWVAAADSTMAHLASSPTTRKDLTFLKQYSGQRTFASTGHLTSFVGGNFILGGILLKQDKYKQFGLKLAESYFQTYNQTASGIGPEVFSWVDDGQATGGDNPLPPADQADFYEHAGFWVKAGDYVLRPETMESLYYAYRLTGNKKYQDLAWHGFNSINNKCRAGSGYSGLNDVTKPDGGGYDDFQQSFFLAETLKYLYLIFADDSPVQVQADRANEFVFNTEAHPIRIK